MFTPELESWIRRAVEDVSDGGIDPEVDENGGIRVGFTVPIEEDGEESAFWVTFTQNAPDYYGDNPPPDVDIQQYLVISWWVPGEEFGIADLVSNAGVYSVLDSFNQEPGIKCRLDYEEDGSLSEVFVVVEADIPVSSIDRYGVVVLALDRIVEFIVNNFAIIRTNIEVQIANA
jgi:hypothetical protein